MPMTPAERAEVKRWRDEVLFFPAQTAFYVGPDGKVHMLYNGRLIVRKPTRTWKITGIEA